MITINNLDEMKPYYNKKSNSYIFNDDVEFTFDLDIESDIEAWNIVAKNIRTRDILARNIEALDIEACDIVARGDIKAKYIEAWDIWAWAIRAMDVKALDVKTEYIKIDGDINVLSIIADEIECKGDILYGVVCCSRQGIVCDTIEGRQRNSRHFALNGEVITASKINKKKREKIVC